MFLDGSRRPVSQFDIMATRSPDSWDSQVAYLQVKGSAALAGVPAVSLTTTSQDGSILLDAVSFSLSQVGTSAVYEGELAVFPERCTTCTFRPGPRVDAGLGTGMIRAELNGEPIAAAGTVFPGQFDVKFLSRDVDASGNRQVVALQQTGIGSAAEQYAEKVWLRIEAVNPFDASQVQDVEAEVALAEEPNSFYARFNPRPPDPWEVDSQRFYDGTNGGTWLDANGTLDPADPSGSTRIWTGLDAGRTSVELVAAHRLATTSTNRNRSSSCGPTSRTMVRSVAPWC
jgi:hypothetical protein